MPHDAAIAALPFATALHLLLAVVATGLGPVALWARKGSRLHRAAGWIWVAAMGGTAVSALFVRSTSVLPSWHGFSPIHALVLVTGFGLARALWAIAVQRDVASHQAWMRNTYLGSCIGAGVFTLLPGRYLGDLLWHHGLGWT